MMRLSRLVATMLAVAAIGGCASSPTANFYTLSPEPPPTSIEPASINAASINSAEPRSRALSVVIGPVSVPEVVDRPQFVVRVAPNQVTIDEFARWAEPLKSEIPRTIARDLAILMSDARVSPVQQGADPVTAYRVRIDVLRFDSALGDAATIDVMWSVRPPNGAAVLTGRTVAREPVASKDYGALVAAHGRALETVSRDIAAAIRQASAQ
jgi:hypothetical protein